MCTIGSRWFCSCSLCDVSRRLRLWPFWLNAACPCISEFVLTQAPVPVRLSPPSHPWGDLHGRPAHLSVRACHLSQCLGDGCVGQEPRKGGFRKGGFCRVQCHGQGNKKYRRTLAPAVHLALRAPQPREACNFAKTPF